MAQVQSEISAIIEKFKILENIRGWETFICETEEELSRIQNEKNQLGKFEQTFEEIDSLLHNLVEKKSLIFDSTITENDITDVRTHYDEGKRVRLNCT